MLSFKVFKMHMEYYLANKASLEIIILVVILIIMPTIQHIDFAFTCL